MADFPIAKTNAIPEVTPIMAKHLNNLEDKVGIDSSTDPNSLDYRTGMLEVDHDPTDGSHREGIWRIGGNAVTATGAELNQALDGIGPTVTAANLTSLTDGSSIGSVLHTHGVAIAYLTMKNNSDQAASKLSWFRLDLGTAIKDVGGIITYSGTPTTVITLPTGYNYQLFYKVCYASLLSTPPVQARFHVLTGDTSWDFDSWSFTETELYHGYSEVCTNFWSGLFIPNVDTTLRLEVITSGSGGTQDAKVRSCSVGFWTIY